MTNLIATVVITLNTNWVSQSKQVPFCHFGNDCRLEHTQLVKQLGTVVTNWTAKCVFEGRELRVLLKSEEEKIPSQERTVVEPAKIHELEFVQWRVHGNGQIVPLQAN